VTESNTPLAGKVAFVTGASKGIGRAIAIGLAAAGAKVALTGRHEGDGPGTAGETAKVIRAAGGEALPLICDVRHEKAVEAAFGACAEEFGRLDVLMNNAGLFHPGFTVESTSLEMWDETIGAHIRGPFLCSRFALAHFDEAGGSIINMSSTAGDVTYRSAGLISYAVGKAGMEQFTRGLALELAGRNIAVNAIRPMSLYTEAVTKYIKDPDRLAAFEPPEAIVPAILFLAQCRSEFTGNVVNRTDFVDGHFPQMVVPSPFS
jgi:NAD(P)-dependent dehydrogenase (short-subunit alcohol dehydrogenase family)